MAYDTEQLMAEISDHWYKQNDGNLYQLVDSFNSVLNLISNDAEKVEQWREVSQAQGKTLDLIGDGEAAYRPNDNDDTYRFLIYLDYLIARAQGTAPTIRQIAGTALQTKDVVKVVETKPRHVKIIISYSQFRSLPTQNFILSHLQKLMALGCWLDGISLPVQASLNQHIGGAMTTNKTTTIHFGAPVWWTGYSLPVKENIYVGGAMKIESKLNF